MTDLLELLNAGERNISRLTDPTELRGAAARVLEFARSRGVTSLHAASPAAERVVGAALVSAPDGMDVLLSTQQLTAPVALVVDVNLASGTAVAHAARRVRRAGVDHVLAAVLHQLTPSTPGPQDCYVDELVVLDDHRGLTGHANNK
jgi:hypothetical protein